MTRGDEGAEKLAPSCITGTRETWYSHGGKQHCSCLKTEPQDPVLSWRFYCRHFLYGKEWDAGAQGRTYGHSRVAHDAPEVEHPNDP